MTSGKSNIPAYSCKLCLMFWSKITLFEVRNPTQNITEWQNAPRVWCACLDVVTEFLSDMSHDGQVMWQSYKHGSLSVGVSNSRPSLLSLRPQTTCAHWPQTLQRTCQGSEAHSLSLALSHSASCQSVCKTERLIVV